MKKQHLAVVTVAWFVAALACLAVVKLTSIGPVIWVLSHEHGMGVHIGDALILIPLGVAFMLTRALAKR